ncbi:MAG: hypothetical protein ACI9TH_000552 [Kiritimatiellia bacterium]|jgi:hypothetical protein
MDKYQAGESGVMDTLQKRPIWKTLTYTPLTKTCDNNLGGIPNEPPLQGDSRTTELAPPRRSSLVLLWNRNLIQARPTTSDEMKSPFSVEG